MSLLSQKHLQNEEAAYAWVEARLWPHGPVCPHCGEKERVSKMKGKATRVGLHKCYKCRKQFNVKIGTIFEQSPIKLYIWLQAIYLIVSSKKGISANQLSRTLDVSLKTAWFMGHRIREAMRTGDLSRPMGGGGGIVEIDETFIGKKAGYTAAGYAHKNAVLTLVDREGDTRSFHIDRANQNNILPVIRENLDKEARVVTDDAGYYRNLDREYLHAFVIHSKRQYGRGEIHTNTVEGYFSIFKRGMKGVYQHCSAKHLHRYLAEYDFRYNNRIALGVDDSQRFENAVKGVVGKRLTYRTPDKEMSENAT